MLGHLRDVDADFLAVYGIDLAVEELDGPRFFGLAHRLPAYQGVVAARVDAEKQETRPSGPQQEPVAPSQAADGVQEVSLTAFRVQFPGLVSMATSG